MIARRWRKSRIANQLSFVLGAGIEKRVSRRSVCGRVVVAFCPPLSVLFCRSIPYVYFVRAN